jgi:hypothetical protein
MVPRDDAIDEGGRAATYIGGRTFEPGTHSLEDAINFDSGVVILDGLNKANAQFLFQAGTTLTTAGGTYLLPTDQRDPSKERRLGSQDCRHPWSQQCC